MATEPRKPKFTNRKVLKAARNLLVDLSLAGIIGTFLWPPALAIGMGLLMVAYLPEGALMRLRAWERAQWTPAQSDVSTIELDASHFRSMVESSRLESRQRPIKATLKNGHTVTIFWDVFSAAGPSYTISYETRVIDEERECRNSHVAVL